VKNVALVTRSRESVRLDVSGEVLRKIEIEVGTARVSMKE
jgi:ribosomal protein L28